MKKRPALLLEVIIAISLLAMGASFLIRQPILLYRTELDHLERVECDRIAAWTYSEIREQLLKGKIRWQQIPPLKQKVKPLYMTDADLSIPPILTRKVQRNYSLETVREKQSEGEIHRLVSVHIEIGMGKKKRQFTYQLNISRKNETQTDITPS